MYVIWICLLGLLPSAIVHSQQTNPQTSQMPFCSRASRRMIGKSSVDMPQVHSLIDCLLFTVTGFFHHKAWWTWLLANLAAEAKQRRGGGVVRLHPCVQIKLHFLFLRYNIQNLELNTVPKKSFVPYNVPPISNDEWGFITRWGKIERWQIYKHVNLIKISFIAKFYGHGESNRFDSFLYTNYK